MGKTNDANSPSAASLGSPIGVLFVVVLVLSLAASIWSRNSKQAAAVPNAAPDVGVEGGDPFYLMIL
jgi:hypothetical protein